MDDKAILFLNNDPGVRGIKTLHSQVISVTTSFRSAAKKIFGKVLTHCKR